MSFVTAFRGARDGFHQPTALARAGLLAEHITDFAGFPSTEFSGALEKVFPVLSRRRPPELGGEKLRSLLSIALHERIPSASWAREVRRIDANDSRFSRQALAAAIRNKADFFLYHPYAYEAFAAPEAQDKIKVLHQYHPHPEFERRILAKDRKRCGIEFQMREYAEILPSERIARWTGALELADHVICPCSAVAASIREFAEISAESTTIIPYGADALSSTRPGGGKESGTSPKPYALFVGNGIQRKGLHWLLRAWERLGSVGRDLDLVMVVRKLDRVFRHGFHFDRPGLRAIQAVSQPSLNRLICEAAFLVNPSLLEGFGHVYLEALAAGTPVIGGRVSLLDDLPPSDDVMIWDGEDEQSLADLIKTAAERHGARAGQARPPCKVIRNYTWEAFHEGIAHTARTIRENGRCAGPTAADKACKS